MIMPDDTVLPGVRAAVERALSRLRYDLEQWHLLPADWERTMTRQRRMTRAGIYVLQFSPAQLRREPAGALADIAAALKVGRVVPGITTRPTAA